MLVYDELLDEYIDEHGEVYNGIKEVTITDDEFIVEKSEVQKNIDNALLVKKQQQVIALERAITNQKQQLDALKQQQEQLKDELLKSMQDNDIYSVKLGNVTLTRKKSYTKTTIDSKRLKEEMPDIAKIYEKITEVDESLLIKIGGTDNEF